MRVATAFSGFSACRASGSGRSLRARPGGGQVALRRRRLLSGLRVLVRDARTRGLTTPSGAISISGSGGWRFTRAGGGCGARSTGRAPRASRSPGRGRSSRATSSAWSRGWRRAPTRPTDQADAADRLGHGRADRQACLRRRPRSRPAGEPVRDRDRDGAGIVHMEPTIRVIRWSSRIRSMRCGGNGWLCCMSGGGRAGACMCVRAGRWGRSGSRRTRPIVRRRRRRRR